MTGLNPDTGRAIDPRSDEYVILSATDVLTTPIGSRVMLRAYGSHLSDLVDQPNTPITRQRLYGATALALLLWHRASRLKSVRLVGEGSSAELQLDLVRTDLPRPRALSMSLPLRAVATRH
ncbi:phage baseplate protein [Brevundimonas sp.]|uniref:phage baseplate protein n=1 Tax=Brevundimonas sp. TaxID=1871086 RepID=UPI000E81B9AD|nr:phage baseplate protein [Brevundimonas sp.]HBY42422.1 hypothetical protein [Brevundimonas sp.]